MKQHLYSVASNTHYYLTKEKVAVPRAVACSYKLWVVKHFATALRMARTLGPEWTVVHVFTDSGQFRVADVSPVCGPRTSAELWEKDGLWHEVHAGRYTGRTWETRAEATAGVLA